MNSGARKYILGVRQDVVFWSVFIVILIPFSWFMYQSYEGLNNIIKNLYLTHSESTASYLHKLEIKEPNEIVSRTALEFDTLTNRNARAVSFIATRTWLRFMSSAFGGILIFVGSIFILSKIEAGETKMDGSAGEVSISVVSTSPGLLLAAIGAILIVSPNHAEQQISTNDASSYFATFANGALPGNASGLPPAETPAGKKDLSDLLDANRNK